jgi:hypothetical protein
LYDYNFRAYSPVIGRFTSPDNIVPDPTRSEDWNRFMYVGGNPTGHTDPTGHQCTTTQADGCKNNYPSSPSKGSAPVQGSGSSNNGGQGNGGTSSTGSSSDTPTNLQRVASGSTTNTNKWTVRTEKSETGVSTYDASKGAFKTRC